MASLLAIRGPLTGMRIKLGDTTRLGRAETADIVLPDALASREHARIVRRNLSWLLEDLESRHGTYVNREKVEGTRALLRNDEIRIGQSLFLFDSDFDIQNAAFSDRSVFLATSSDETIGVAPVAVLPGADGRDRPAADDPAIEFVVRLGELFDPSTVSFPEALRRTSERIAALFGADGLVLMLWDSAAGELRASVALSPHGDVIADGAVIRQVQADGKALLKIDQSPLPAHPSAEAPSPPAVRSILAAPLDAGGTSIGVLYLERYELDGYSLVDLRNTQAVARLLAVFVEARQRAEALLLRTRYAVRDTPMQGRSEGVKKALELAARIAPTSSTVLITGETGTGKEVLAREIHRLSIAGGRSGPFIPVNCSAIPENLFESLLFGHERGAFTGAVKTQQGYIEQANGGTLFLDEIGELSPTVQPKLLRFLQEKVFQRVGGSHTIRAEVRLVCATNRSLEEEVRAGRFREDLFHRIGVFPIALPPLRERRADIGPLAEHFVRLHAAELGRPIVGIGQDATLMLERYEWPGNVRELSNCIERAVLLCDDKVLLARHFQFLPASNRTPAPARESAPAKGSEILPLEEIERRHIRAALEATGHNQVKAAEALGIHRNTLRKKIAEYGLE